MSTLYNYFNNWLYSSSDTTNIIPQAPPITIQIVNKHLSSPKTIKYSLTLDDLQKTKLNLKKQHSINNYPFPARNIPNNLSLFQLQDITKLQLQEILSVKLRKTQIPIKQTIFPPRSEVLQELLSKFNTVPLR